MPFINIKIAAPTVGQAEIASITRGITTMMAEILGKKADLTSVLLERVIAADWSIGGQPVPLAAHMDAKVTMGTNTTDEKARFVAEAHKLLRSVLGSDLPVATYVVVHEVPADAWGYAGLTQAQRATTRAPEDPARQAS